MSLPRYGTPPWLILCALEDGGTCPVTAEQLWAGLASPIKAHDPRHQPVARWTMAAHRVVLAQLVRDGLALELDDGRYVAASRALLSQIREAA